MMIKKTLKASSNTKPAVIISTYPTKKSIKEVANNVVKLKLAACVNMTQISSVYSWQGSIENGSEYLAVFKTTLKNKKRLTDHIRKTHPYKVPEIAEIKLTSINSTYMKWITSCTL